MLVKEARPKPSHLTLSIILKLKYKITVINKIHTQY